MQSLGETRRFGPLAALLALIALGCCVVLWFLQSSRRGSAVTPPVAANQLIVASEQPVASIAQDTATREEPPAMQDLPAPSALVENGPRPQAADVSYRPSSAQVEVDLQRASDSFLTQSPDLEALLGALALAADLAIVDPDSGLAQIPGTDFAFQVSEDGNGLSVKLRRFADETQEFAACDTTLAFGKGEGASKLTVRVQNHPRTDRPPEEFLAPGEERFTGWVMSCKEDGAVMQPLSMSIAKQGEWRVGYAQTLSPQNSSVRWNPSLRDKWIAAMSRKSESR